MGEKTGRSSPIDLQRPWVIWAIGFAGALLYVCAFRTWFWRDDFTWIWWTDRQSWWETLFSTEVYLYYRPLHAGLFKALYGVFGLSGAAFAAVSLLLHFAHLVLLGFLLRRLFDDHRLSVLALILYATSPFYDTVIYWRSNYGTQLCTVFILAALLFQVQWMTQARGTLALAGMFTMTALALLSKQQGLQVALFYPLVAFVLFKAKRAKLSVRQAASVWGLLAAMCAAYCVFDRVATVQTYPWLKSPERFLPPTKTLSLTLQMLSSEMLFVAAWDRMLSLPVRWIGLVLTKATWVPIVLGVVLWWRGNAAERFGWTFALLGLFPALLVWALPSARMYYLGLAGYGLIWASLGLRAWDASRGSKRGRWIRLALGMVLAYALVNNLFAAQLNCLRRGDRSQERKRLFEAIENLPADAIPRHSSLVLADSAENQMAHFPYNVGLLEFIRLARRDDTLVAYNLTPVPPEMLELPPPNFVLEPRRNRLVVRPITDGDKRSLSAWWPWREDE